MEDNNHVESSVGTGSVMFDSLEPNFTEIQQAKTFLKVMKNKGFGDKEKLCVLKELIVRDLVPAIEEG